MRHGLFSLSERSRSRTWRQCSHSKFVKKQQSKLCKSHTGDVVNSVHHAGDSIVGSSNTAKLGLTAITNPLPTAATFEPQLPDTGVLAVQGLVIALTIGTAAYWWLVVVPSERAALGRNKRLGQLNSYLQELERPEAVRSRWLERWFYTDWLRQREERRKRKQHHLQPPEVEDSSSTAMDPYDDLTQPVESSLLRPAASTPNPRFFSLDNPIVATAVLLLVAALVANTQQ